MIRNNYMVDVEQVQGGFNINETYTGVNNVSVLLSHTYDENWQYISTNTIVGGEHDNKHLPNIAELLKGKHADQYMKESRDKEL